MLREIRLVAAVVVVVFLVFSAGHRRSRAAGNVAEDKPDASVVDFVTRHCLDCHNGVDQSAGLDLEAVVEVEVARNLEVWERVVRKLQARQMPPREMPRPEEKAYEHVLHLIAGTLDRIALEDPQPGRTETFRRLTRTEYQNAVRDLLAIDINASSLLPADEASHGFDNITVGDLSPTLMNRYITAARQISRLAIGASTRAPGGATYRAPPDRTQEERVEGLPLGTRGGMLISHTFPVDGEYEFEIRLARDRNEHVEGLHEPHELELLLDRKQLKQFEVRPPRGQTDVSDEYSRPTHANVDRHLKVRIPVAAGPHEVGVTFLKKGSSLLETARQPLNVHYNMYRHPRLGPAIYQVSIAGPFDASGPGETPSRERVFSCYPAGPDEETDCARQIISRLMRLAYRRPVDEQDLARPLALFHQKREREGFEAGIEMALSAILINPQFLFRIERDPEGIPPGTPYRISDLELASRLSFFLWSSLPDEELLEVAQNGRLSDPSVLEVQTRRMLADQRARALVTNFAGQWLYLRNLKSITPDLRLYPDFDDNLREAFRRETELLLESVLGEDRSVLDLLKSDHTFLNERLARHYRIPHVYGTHFRRVTLDKHSRRGGLLRHGSILTVTSYATRTSPVLRGKWILENILGTPPPPPPADVPALEDNTVDASLTVRERLAEHRANPACASCHDLIDPVGFSLENFDAVGQWRETQYGRPVDASGGLPDGTEVNGVAGLEDGLLARPELFVGTMVEKLLTYALGRGVGFQDAPAVRAIVRRAEEDDWRFSSLILGVVSSRPFQMRTSK